MINLHKHTVALRRCLWECDVRGVMALWAHISPGTPQPKNEAEALATIHLARTQMPSMRLSLRAYSHRWLLDHGLPSALPDKLRPRAERMYPRIADAVGVAICTTSPLFRPIMKIVEREVAVKVAQMYADGDREPASIRAQILETKTRAMRRLVGTIK